MKSRFTTESNIQSKQRKESGYKPSNKYKQATSVGMMMTFIYLFYSEGVIMMDYMEKKTKWTIPCIRIKTTEESNQVKTL